MIIRAFKNFLWFGLDFFSIPLLFKTLFSYWRRYHWFYGKRIDVARYVEVFISNSFSRIVGAMVRTVLIIMGVLVEVLIFLSGIFVFLVWLLLPLLMILGFCFGLKQILF